jgi:hypothetical protein
MYKNSQFKFGNTVKILYNSLLYKILYKNHKSLCFGMTKSLKYAIMAIIVENM